MQENFIKLKELIEKIITETDLDQIDLDFQNGTFELHSSSDNYFGTCYVGSAEKAEKVKVRVGIDTMVILTKGNVKVTDNLINIIRMFEGK